MDLFYPIDPEHESLAYCDLCLKSETECVGGFDPAKGLRKMYRDSAGLVACEECVPKELISLDNSRRSV